MSDLKWIFGAFLAGFYLAFTILSFLFAFSDPLRHGPRRGPRRSKDQELAQLGQRTALPHSGEQACPDDLLDKDGDRERDLV